MVYAEDDYLMLSGIQHFQFCKRQWALIHIEQQWLDNEATAHGQVLHTKADNPYIKEKRKELLVSRAMPISSAELGLSGIMDVVEFYKDDQGVSLRENVGNGYQKLWNTSAENLKRYQRYCPVGGSDHVFRRNARLRH